MTTPPRPIRVLLVDDHDLIRRGLRRALERDGQFAVVGEAGTVLDALRLAGELAPDVVVMDLRLPDGSGLYATRTLRETSATVVVVTMYAGDDELFGAMEAGAGGFVSKSAPIEDVVAAVRQAAATPAAFSAAGLVAVMKRRLAPTGPHLSPRERQVLALLVSGATTAGIAATLAVSVSTAKTHVSHVYKKLGAANRAQALMTALQLGLLETEPSPEF